MEEGASHSRKNSSDRRLTALTGTKNRSDECAKCNPRGKQHGVLRHAGSGGSSFESTRRAETLDHCRCSSCIESACVESDARIFFVGSHSGNAASLAAQACVPIS